MCIQSIIILFKGFITKVTKCSRHGRQVSEVPDAIDAMNVVPDGFAQSGGVHI